MDTYPAIRLTVSLPNWCSRGPPTHLHLAYLVLHHASTLQMGTGLYKHHVNHEKKLANASYYGIH